MSDRRTFLGNAAAAAVIAKISPLRSFGFTSDGPETIHPTMSDREKAALHGSVKECTEETIISGIEGRPEIRSSQTTVYDPDGRILSTSLGSTDGSKWVSTNIYDDNGRLTKTISGNATEPGTETLYAYDEAGRLLSITKSGKEVGSKSEFHYDEQGRKTAVQHFDPNVKRAQAMYADGSSWDAAVEGGAWVPVGGNTTTIYDGNDQPTEAQIRDREGRVVSRFVRTYDANGRILEEKQILENPALLMADKLDPDGQPQFNAAQLEATNTVMKLLMLGGRSDAGITYAYDAQGRVTEIRDRNGWFDKVTTISYNEHGDRTAQRETMTRNSAAPDVVAYSVDENGTITPERRTTEPTESPGPDLDDLAGENEVRYEYEYDSYGNWTQQTVNHAYGPDSPSNVRHRKLTYY
jgi:YD repeat-containing protein